jgi:hypothetical protein
MIGGSDRMFDRNSSGKGEESDMDYFITSDLPMDQVYSVLKSQDLGESQIEKTMEEIEDARKKIKKVVNRFLKKLEVSYGHLDVPDLYKKGLKHAEKAGLSPIEIKAFLNHVQRGDVYSVHSYQNEQRYTPMAKFLGFPHPSGQMINISSKDHSKLNELAILYKETAVIHNAIKNQTYAYTDCAPQALTGQFGRRDHNVEVYINPIIAALFLPKIMALERTMLMSNIARMILSRAQAYIRTNAFHLQQNISPIEIDAEASLARNYANDPNALEHFNEDTPVENMIKRYRCQVELYHTVINLRQGRYYARGYGSQVGISGLKQLLDSYNWTFFDSPDMYGVDDEGSFLRKLLAVFSIRPTLTQLSSFTPRYGMGFTTVNALAKTVFLAMPVVNVKLPIDTTGSGDTATSLELSRALTQTDFIIEHKAVVPKNKVVMHSDNIAFFYVNRRYPSIGFTTGSMNMRPVGMPLTLVNQLAVNSTNLMFDLQMRIGRAYFDLRSVVVLNRSPVPDFEIATGYSSIVVSDNKSNETLFYHYNPSVAGRMELAPESDSGSSYESPDPIRFLSEYTDDKSRYLSFRTEAQERGTIFLYVQSS